MVAPKPAWSNSTFVRTSLPFFGFVVFAWLGMSQLMESKLRIRHQVRGYDKVEEYDPMERMKKLSPSRAAVHSLEEELKESLHKEDIHNFDYKPVPRTNEDED